MSGEESAGEVRLRAERLGPGAFEVPVLAENELYALVVAGSAGRGTGCWAPSCCPRRSRSASWA